MIGALILGFNARYHEDIDSTMSSIGDDSNHTGDSDSLESQTAIAGSLCLIAGSLAVAWAIVMIGLLVLNIDWFKLNFGSKYLLVVVG